MDFSEIQQIIRQLYHPQTVAMMDFACSYQTMMRTLQRLRRTRKAYIIGQSASGGRPKDVYANRKWKSDNIEHELAVTRVLKHWGTEGFLRGSDVDRGVLPDAQVDLFCLEMDMGTESLSQVQARLNKYRDTEHFAVFVCQSQQRMVNIQRRGRDELLVTTMEQALASEPVCWDAQGADYRLLQVLKTAREKANAM